MTTKTASGWIPSAAPYAIGCTICCSSPLASSWMMIMPTAASVPAPPSATSTENAPADHAPRYGMYAARNVTMAMVAASGTPSSTAPIPTTTALNAATIVTPKK